MIRMSNGFMLLHPVSSKIIHTENRNRRQDRVKFEETITLRVNQNYLMHPVSSEQYYSNYYFY